MEEVYLNTLKLDSKKIHTLDYIEIEDFNVRIYYIPNEELGLGFSFYAVENVGHICNEFTGKDEWHKESCFVSCIVTGLAYFDGIRHLYYGDEATDNYGYHYSAHLGTIIETLKGLQTLEEKYCKDL
tara:strand:+ start:1923 stop:2303 length:381 start_codon:yes stop_codon:yes gene_type:complete